MRQFVSHHGHHHLHRAIASLKHVHGVGAGGYTSIAGGSALHQTYFEIPGGEFGGHCPSIIILVDVPVVVRVVADVLGLGKGRIRAIIVHAEREPIRALDAIWQSAPRRAGQRGRGCCESRRINRATDTFFRREELRRSWGCRGSSAHQSK